MTLAEVLITIMIIGIMAVLILPTLRSDIDDKVYDSAKKVFEGKFTEGLHKMRIKGDLGRRYETTLDFANALADYMKVGSICTKSNLTSCFADKINATKASVLYNTKDLETTEDLGANFKADLVAMTFGDGTTALLGYNPDCLVTDIYNSNADVTECLIMIYDTNSKKAPNILDMDIASMNLFSDEDSEIEIGEVFNPTSYTQADCQRAIKDDAPIKACAADGTFLYGDRWAHATHKCHKQGKRLPTSEELRKIAEQLYGEPISTGYVQNGLSIADNELWTKLTQVNIGGGSRTFFTSNELSETSVIQRQFYTDKVYPLTTGAAATDRGNYYALAFCISEK